MIVDLANETIWSLSWKFLNFLVHGRSLSIIDATVNGPRYILGGLAEKLAKYSGSQRVQWMTEDPNEPRVNLGRSVSKDALVISRLSAFVKHLTTDDYFQVGFRFTHDSVDESIRHFMSTVIPLDAQKSGHARKRHHRYTN